MDKRLIALFGLILTSSIVFADLVELTDDDLSNTLGSTGIELDIDISDLEFSFSYRNLENPNEQFWIVAADPGGELAKLNGLEIDVVTTVDGGALSIGMPESIELREMNTGDFVIAHPNSAGGNETAPFIDTDTSNGASNEGLPISEQRKLIGLRWNSQIGVTTGNGAVDNYNFNNQDFQMSGRVLLFGL